MPFDLAISEFDDLLFSASGDMLGASGQALMEQRIRLRLKIIRGSWLYDSTDRLGSFLHTIPAGSLEDVQEQVEVIVRDALAPMNDIVVTGVEIERITPGGMIIVQVQYDLSETDTIDTSADVEMSGSLTVQLPGAGG